MTELDTHGNARQQLLAIHPSARVAPYPPETRAECASIARPCNRYACRHHLWPQTERAGRPHHGTHNFATVDIEGLTARNAPSCSLDIAEEDGPKDDHGNVIEGFGKERANKEVAVFVPAPTQSRKGKRKSRVKGDVIEGDHVPLTAEITKERVRQIVERGLDKQWSAMTFVQAFEDFYSTFVAAGGAIDFLWGHIIDPNEDDGGHSIEQIKNDKGRIWVTVALNTTKVMRPQHAERLQKREAARAGVTIRRK